ncbi:MAG: dihydrodipicolinate reductase C-terminal domain-containing protein [Christensenellales bacterium]
MVGEHSVFFLGRMRSLKFVTRLFPVRYFATGALRSAKYLVGKLPGLYDMDDVIG